MSRKTIQNFVRKLSGMFMHLAFRKQANKWINWTDSEIKSIWGTLLQMRLEIIRILHMDLVDRYFCFVETIEKKGWERVTCNIKQLSKFKDRYPCGVFDWCLFVFSLTKIALTCQHETNQNIWNSGLHYKLKYFIFGLIFKS